MGVEDKFRKASDLNDAWGVDMLLTGSPGAGKTYLIGSGVNDPEMCGEIFVIDVKGGLRTLADQTGITVFKPSTEKDITEALEWLISQGKTPKRTVAIDLISEVYGHIIIPNLGSDFKTRGGQPTREAFGVANRKTIELVDKFRGLSTRYGWNVIFTSHATETKDELTGGIIVRPNMTPGTLNSVVGAVDVAVYLEAENRRRRTYLVATDRFWAKVRIPPSHGTVPDFVDNLELGDLLRVIKGIAEPESLGRVGGRR
jgi:hypothetical protein